MRCAAVLALRCHSSAAKTRTGILNSALWKRLGRLNAATTISISSTVTFISLLNIYKSFQTIAMSEKPIQITLRRSSCRRSGDSLAHSFLGTTLQEHVKQIQNILTDWYMKMVNQDLPLVLLKHKFIKSKEEYKAEEHARYIEEVLANILDRLETYLAGNVFGRKEIINGERKMERKKRNMQGLAHTVGLQILELIKQKKLLALERAERNYRAELAGIHLKTKTLQKSEEEHNKIKELDNRSRIVESELKEMNERDKNMFSYLFEKK